MTFFLHHFSRAFRRLLRVPTYFVLSVAILSIGCGAVTAVYSVIDSIFFKSNGVPNWARLVRIYHSSPTARASSTALLLSWPDFTDLKRGQSTFETLTAWSPFRQATVIGRDVEVVWGEAVLGDYFSTLGINPRVGRLIQPADIQNSLEVAVISERLWAKLGSPGALTSETVQVNGRSFRVVGVAPVSFRGSFSPEFLRADLWIPLNQGDVVASSGLEYSLDPLDRDKRWLFAFGMLAPNKSIQEANLELEAVARRLDAEYPLGRGFATDRLSSADLRRDWSAADAARHRFTGGDETIFGSLAALAMTATVLLLVVTVSNVGNLTFARVARRRQESVLKAHLGASRWHLVAEQLAETAVLATLGGLCGLLVAAGLSRILGGPLSVGEGVVVEVSPSFSFPVYLVATASSILALLVAGLAPAWQAAKIANGPIGTDDHGVFRGRRRGDRPVALQVAISSALLMICAVSSSSVRHRMAATDSLHLSELVVVRMASDLQRLDFVRTEAAAANILSRVREIPGVEAAAVADGLPMLSSSSRGNVEARLAGSSRSCSCHVVALSQRGLSTLGIELIRGTDLDNVSDSVLLSKSAAQELFGTEDPLGRTVDYRPRSGTSRGDVDTWTVAGVVEDVGEAADSRAIYLPHSRYHRAGITVLARTAARGSIGTLAEQVRRAVRDAEPAIAVIASGGGDVTARARYSLAASAAASTGVLGLVTLVLALVGLYGVVSLMLTARLKEFGLRMAVGASRRHIITFVLTQGLRPVLSGLAVGAVLGALLIGALWQVVPGALDGIRLEHLALPAAIIAFGAAIGCAFPAWRAARIMPYTVLKGL